MKMFCFSVYRLFLNSALFYHFARKATAFFGFYRDSNFIFAGRIAVYDVIIHAFYQQMLCMGYSQTALYAFYRRFLIWHGLIVK